MPYGKFEEVLAGDTVTWQDLGGQRHSAMVIVANKTRVTLVQDNQVILTVTRARFEGRNPVVVRRPFDPTQAGHPAAAWAASEVEQVEDMEQRRARRRGKTA